MTAHECNAVILEQNKFPIQTSREASCCVYIPELTYVSIVASIIMNCFLTPLPRYMQSVAVIHIETS